MIARSVSVLLLVAVCACSADVQPVAIDARVDACHRCRMIASDPHLAAEIVAPGEEPLIFDDIGCLRDHVRERPLPRSAVVYVADHRTGNWIVAERAVYTRIANASTPMASGLIAHADDASRDADVVARTGERVAWSAVIGGAATVEGKR